MNVRTRVAIATLAALSYLSAAVSADADTATPAGPPATASAPVGAAAIAAAGAPADENFGPLRLSVLGVHNYLANAAARIVRGGIDPARTVEHLALIELSVRDWETKYPRDAWLPRAVLDLHRAYRKIATDDAALHAIDAASWLLHKYGASHEAQALRTELAEALENPVATASAQEEPVDMPTVGEKE
jgi:hypothetical protein